MKYNMLTNLTEVKLSNGLKLSPFLVLIYSTACLKFKSK